MAGQPDKLTIAARHLGPIMSLDGELTEHPQNLIFARNGTGKSFLSRALRCFDKCSLGADLSEEAINLVSDESNDGRGYFSISQGDAYIAELRLDRMSGNCIVSNQSVIFHVFSEDFITSELREQSYNIDGNITSQIALDAENIELTEAENDLATSRRQAEEQRDSLSHLLTSEKELQLVSKAGVRKTLREYGEITLERLSGCDAPDPPPVSFQQRLIDLDALKGIPAEPDYPDPLEWKSDASIDWEALRASLSRETSVSTVATEFKAKIDTNPDFYKAGVELMSTPSDLDNCPFCEQEIRDPRAKNLIDQYTAYFSDAENSHKAELRVYFAAIQRVLRDLTGLRQRVGIQRARFDALKVYLPSRKTEALLDVGTLITNLQEAHERALKLVGDKGRNVSTSVSIDLGLIDNAATELEEALSDLDARCLSLREAIQLSDAERKSIHREICNIFSNEFLITHYQKFESLRQLKRSISEKSIRLEMLQRAAPSQDARTRVSDTFKLLLKAFFVDKYRFDDATFTLRRGESEMTRGPEKTLSDGEKATIAFCYFIASIHKKVASNADYAKLFLVFDDPVTSMSYDYVFSIAQTLKGLAISRTGEVSINLGFDTNLSKRPRLLILTHNTYFFNISVTNKVVKGGAAFSLSVGTGAHAIASLKRYVAPFQQQLRDVVSVAGGAEPDHTTANSVRSVLEAIGRFCRPDKTANLSDFIIHLAGEEGIEVKSVLINSFSHGTFMEEIAPPDDLRKACEEAVLVVRRYASGQLDALGQ